MKLYVAYSTDKYRLPIAVADSAAELARIVGVSERRVLMECSPSFENHSNLGRLFARVEFDDDDEFEDIIL